MSFWERLEQRARSGLNQLQDKIVEFEDSGGFSNINERLSEIGSKVAEGYRAGEAKIAAKIAALSPNKRRELQDWYARLGVPYGSDFPTVRRAYLQLMRQYHPDNFAKDRDEEERATEISQELTSAYQGLRRHLTADQRPAR